MEFSLIESMCSPSATSIASFRQRVNGCWLGKAVGGTLGMPYEGQDGPFDLEYYRPIPQEMLPNDDLDLQVVWACVLDKLKTPTVDRHILAQAWLDHVEFPWDEYGIAIRNLKLGLRPPLSGSYDNWFSNGMGAPIRSEIWACVAPGQPKLAAAYAYEDACVDHDGEGIWAEIFLAALESAAFVDNDPHRLLDVALDFLPRESVTRQAVSDTREWLGEQGDWRVVREKILERYGQDNFTDAPMNIAFTILGWLASGGDFGKGICITVNCGKDADCTGATVGALMGIIDPDSIANRWLAPIGRSLVLSAAIVGLDPPATLDDFTDLVIGLRDKLNARAPSPRSYVQSTDAFRIRARRMFVEEFPDKDVPPSFSRSEEILLPGNLARLSRDDFQMDTLLLRYEFRIETAGPVITLLNTRQNCRVWLDGALAFARRGGCMAPSLHRAPDNQSCVKNLTAGKHELVVAIQCPLPGQDAEWVVGVGDPRTSAWFPRAFVA